MTFWHFPGGEIAIVGRSEGGRFTVVEARRSSLSQATHRDNDDVRLRASGDEPLRYEAGDSGTTHRSSA